MNLNDQLKNVKTKDDFILFLQALRKDFQTNKDAWENLTLDHYLESIEAWKTDTMLLPNEPDWKTLAQIMLAGKYYE